ncbi:MAG: HupE/UreJ family protein [Cyanobium sp.]
MTSPISRPSLALLAGASALALMLTAQPAEAHGIATGGMAAGFLHPLQGLDHLLLLLGVGTAAAALSSQLLLWGLAGAAVGGLVGGLGGALPGQELLAALAISALGALVLAEPRARSAHHALCGGLVAVAVAVHALLHALEAPRSASAISWWLGAAAASMLVSGGGFLLLRRLPGAWIRGTALLLTVLGGGLTLAQLNPAQG